MTFIFIIFASSATLVNFNDKEVIREVFDVCQCSV